MAEGKEKGWISIYRKIRENWLWQQKPFDKAHAWIDILLSVNHKDSKVFSKGELKQVKKGSMLTSDNRLAEKWGWSRKAVRNFLSVLSSDGMVTLERTNKGTTLTVENWEMYQIMGTPKDTTWDTAEGQQRVQQRDTNNNDNNNNNVNNDNKYISDSAIHEKALELCKYYEELKPMQSITKDLATLKIFLIDYGFDWCKEALQKTVISKGKFIPGYMEKILKGWVKDGKEENSGGIKQNISAGSDPDREGIGIKL